MKDPTHRLIMAAATATLLIMPAVGASASAAARLIPVTSALQSPNGQPVLLAQYRGKGPAAQGPYMGEYQGNGPAARGSASRRGPTAHSGRNTSTRSLRGHKGYNDYRPGYRQHSDGWWYPPAAFFLGAIIGNALIGHNYSDSHHRWCDARYRSYRWSDGTFQPYHGPRRLCNSPYDGR